MDMTLHFSEHSKILFSWWKTGSFAGEFVKSPARWEYSDFQEWQYPCSSASSCVFSTKLSSRSVTSSPSGMFRNVNRDTPKRPSRTRRTREQTRSPRILSTSLHWCNSLGDSFYCFEIKRYTPDQLNETFSRFTRRLFTSYRLAQGALYGLQVNPSSYLPIQSQFQALLAYALMLIVMTYNMNLILSIVVGEAVGYFLFTGNPLVDHQLTDCCWSLALPSILLPLFSIPFPRPTLRMCPLLVLFPFWFPYHFVNLHVPFYCFVSQDICTYS